MNRKQLFHGKGKIALAVSIGLAFILAATLCVVSAFAFNFPNITLQSESLLLYNSGWYRVSGTEVVPVGGFPGQVTATQDESGSTVTLYNTLPDTVDGGDTLVLKTTGEFVRVLSGGELLYEYSPPSDMPFGSVFGSAIHTVPLSAELAGKTIEVSLYSTQQAAFLTVNDFYLGATSSVANTVLTSNFDRLIFCIFIALLGVGLIFLAILLRNSKSFPGNAAFVWCGIFSILTAIWVYSDSMLLQLHLSNEAMGYIVSYMSFMLLPLAFVMYLRSICRKRWLAADIYCTVYSIYVAVCAALYLFNVIDIAQTLVITHLWIVLGVIVSVWVGILEAVERNRIFLTALAGFGVLGLSAVLSLTVYNLGWFDYSVCYRVGFLVFILLLAWTLVNNAVLLLRQGVESTIYKALAYTDILTGIPNRVAYEEETKRLERLRRPQASLVLLDLDGLKQVNDLFGHAQGDRYISDFASFLQESFRGVGKAYRVGGDEFAVVVTEAGAMRSCLDSLGSKMKQYNQTADCPIYYSWGVSNYIPGVTTGFEELFREADADLYAMKREKSRKKPETMRHRGSYKLGHADLK